MQWKTILFSIMFTDISAIVLKMNEHQKFANRISWRNLIMKWMLSAPDALLQRAFFAAEEFRLASPAAGFAFRPLSDNRSLRLFCLLGPSLIAQKWPRAKFIHRTLSVLASARGLCAFGIVYQRWFGTQLLRSHSSNGQHFQSLRLHTSSYRKRSLHSSVLSKLPSHLSSKPWALHLCVFRIPLPMGTTFTFSNSIICAIHALKPFCIETLEAAKLCSKNFFIFCIPSLTQNNN